MIIVLTIGFLWSFLPCISSFVAYATLEPLTENSPKTFEEKEDLSQARHIQLHFLKFRIYIPLEDIKFESNGQDQSQLGELKPTKGISKWCNHDKNVVWVPIKYKVPIIGERVLQWCLNIPSALRS